MQRSIDGHPVELDIHGEGLPVLMLHGFPWITERSCRAVDPVLKQQEQLSADPRGPSRVRGEPSRAQHRQRAPR